MASGFERFWQTILDWVGASDHRYHEACKMMELDDDILHDIGFTREELMAELGIRRIPAMPKRPAARPKTGRWSGFANRRMARESF